MYKIVDGTAPEIIKEVFKLSEESSCSLRHTSQFTISRVNSGYHDTKSILFLGPKI